MTHPIVVKNIPSWFPGAGFLKIAARSSEMAQKMSQVPFDLVKKRMVIENLTYSLENNRC